MKTISISESTNVWMVSDTHYKHTNICRGVSTWKGADGLPQMEGTRDFKTLSQMNDTIVNNINRVVMPDDVIIHDGDVSFGGFESIPEFLDRINCKNIHLMPGNHDHHIERNKFNIQDRFLSVNHIVQLEFMGRTFVLTHRPLSTWEGIENGVIHLHGHCHLPPHKRFGIGKRMDIGIDGHPEFRPYNLRDEIIPIMDIIPISVRINEIIDHHTTRPRR